MRRRLIAALIALALLAGLVLASASPARALNTFISKVKSDCASVQAEITLIWTHDDGGGYDRFRLEFYDAGSGRLISAVNEQIAQQQSPWFWQTHRVESGASNWHYRLEMWDIDGAGNKLNRLDTVEHDCVTHASWRPLEQPVAKTDCSAWMSFYTTNMAPEDGTLTVVWSYGRSPQEELNHFLAVWPIQKGEGLDSGDFLQVPCNVYIKLFYQPYSTKQLYFMPSQFWPNEGYGTSYVAGGWTPRYYTYFPLDAPPRPAALVEP